MRDIRDEISSALSAAVRKGMSFDPFSMNDLLPSDSEAGSIEVLSSTFSEDGLMVHIYRVAQGASGTVFFASAHGDGGVCVGWSGPSDNVRTLQELYPTNEGWTDH